MVTDSLDPSDVLRGKRTGPVGANNDNPGGVQDGKEKYPLAILREIVEFDFPREYLRTKRMQPRGK